MTLQNNPIYAVGHIDLFTGLGGFSLAAQHNGLQTVVMCEKDDKCRRFLQQTYPDIPVHANVTEFDGTKWRGQFLLTAGVPCQPASRAGKQRGKSDDRWLWPEAIRIINEANPRWCLLENPPGIYDVGFDGILDDLERLGYEVGTVEIPACAVNSPQIRQRVWIMGHRNSSRRGELWGTVTDEKKHPTVECDCDGDLADTTKGRCGKGSGRSKEVFGRGSFEKNGKFDGDYLWSRYLWTPCADGKLRRTPDDSFSVVNGLHRSVLGALGNSIVWQVAAEIIKAIKKADSLE